jgi:iron(III) transport system substrate-binding protein
MGKPLIVLAAVALLLAACQLGSTTPIPAGVGQSAAPSGTTADPAAGRAHPPEVQRLLAAAAGETDLALSWSQNSLGGHEGAKTFEAMFNRLYGTNIRIHFTPGPTHSQMAGKVVQEHAAGHKASTDVLLGTESAYGGLVDLEVLDEYDYTRLAPHITPELLAPRNIAVEIATVFGQLAYNSDLIPAAEAPRRLEDVLNPRWKGRIAATDNACNLERIAYRPEWTPETMKAFVVRLSNHVGGLIRAGELSRLVTGEYLLMVMDCGGHEVRTYKEKGAPIEGVIAEDGASMSFRYLGVPRNATHPNLGKLFVNLILSEEGQATVFATDHTDHHGLPGSRVAPLVNSLKARGVQFQVVDIEFSMQRPELRRLSEELQKILRENRSG